MASTGVQFWRCFLSSEPGDTTIQTNGKSALLDTFEDLFPGAYGEQPIHLRFQPLRRGLKGTGAEEKINDVPFVRLEPVELDGRDGADVQTVDVGRLHQLLAPSLVAGDGTANERLAYPLDHLSLWAFHNSDVGEHVFGLGNLALG